MHGSAELLTHLGVRGGGRPGGLEEGREDARELGEAAVEVVDAEEGGARGARRRGRQAAAQGAPCAQKHRGGLSIPISPASLRHWPPMQQMTP